MALNKNKNLKLYYSIGEVAAMLGVAESTLRYWEDEIPETAPARKTKTGVRQYNESDIEKIKFIHFLVKGNHLTLEGARERLKNRNKETTDIYNLISRLTSVKEELLKIQNELDSTPPCGQPFSGE